MQIPNIKLVIWDVSLPSSMASIISILLTRIWHVTGRDKCEIIIPRITASLGSHNGQYGSAVAPGTELRGSFTMHAISYGLKCRMEIFVNANGTWSVATQYVGGYGICPSTPAWILRTWSRKELEYLGHGLVSSHDFLALIRLTSAFCLNPGFRRFRHTFCDAYSLP